MIAAETSGHDERYSAFAILLGYALSIHPKEARSERLQCFQVYDRRVHLGTQNGHYEGRPCSIQR